MPPTSPTLGATLRALEAGAVRSHRRAVLDRRVRRPAAGARWQRSICGAFARRRARRAPPLFRPSAAARQRRRVMFLAARRYDALARKFQIAAKCASMYADAVAHAGDADGPTLRDLYWCRYWMWELRDAYEDLAPLYARAWRYESRDGHLATQPRALPSGRQTRDPLRRRVLSRHLRRLRSLENAAAARRRDFAP